MKISFVKYHGAGNDFIIIDNRKSKIELSKVQIERLCHRRFGIGADGLMILEHSVDYDFRMKYYNSDGAEGSMCGNGGRCIVAYAFHLNIIESKTHFIAVDGEHHAKINIVIDNILDISLEMNDVSEIQTKPHSYFIDTGSPHHISFVDKVDDMDVFNKGKEIRHSAEYQSINGANVNFVEIADDYLKIRTFERGVEDETYACGTGATAAAIAFSQKTNKYNNEIKIKALGGNLRVAFDINDNVYSNIVLSGPAEFVFSGNIEL